VNAWKIVCATLVIFIAGIVTGASLVRFAQGGPRAWRLQHPVVDNRAQPNPTNPNSPSAPHPPSTVNPTPGLLSREFIQVLEWQLRLTSQQRERINTIMAEGQEHVRELRARIDPEMRKELQQTRERIRSVLTPEQREQFEQLMKRSARRNERNDQPGQPDRRLREPREPRSQPPPQPSEP
jgi:Spy/CpxP family protein refolding chaperone